MERPRSPYREVTDKDNFEILGTLNPALWAAYQRAKARGGFFELSGDVVDARQWLDDAVYMTGSIAGEHRKDVVQALQGQKPPAMALGVPIPTEAQQANGHANAKVPRL